MPNKKSAKKELRKNKKRQAVNLAMKNQLKTLTKKSRRALAGKETTARELLAATIKALDKAAGKKIIKKNAASRTKSRLQKKLNTLGK